MSEVQSIEGKVFVWYLPWWDMLAIGPSRYEVYSPSAFGGNDYMVRTITMFPENWIKVGEL